MAGMTAAALKASDPSRTMDVSVVRDDGDKGIFRFQMVAEDGTRGAPWLESVKILDRIELEHEIDGNIVAETHILCEMKRKNKTSGSLETVQKWMCI